MPITIIFALMTASYAPARGSWHGQAALVLLTLGTLLIGMCAPPMFIAHPPRLTWNSILSLAIGALVISTSLVLAVRSLKAGRERPAFAIGTLILTPLSFLAALWTFTALIQA